MRIRIGWCNYHIPTHNIFLPLTYSLSHFFFRFFYSIVEIKIFFLQFSVLAIEIYCIRFSIHKMILIIFAIYYDENLEVMACYNKDVIAIT